jgi:tRNA 5-methylaminomethyl-2-thiouridine biosynthesis bifunctional protein
VREVVIVGAGVAGACCAAALARRGWRCIVVERHPVPGADASGNPAAIVHGIVHADDGVHARFTRAAALHAERHYREAIAAGRVSGRLDGLLRRGAVAAEAGPPEFVYPADGGLFYPGGGWVVPRDVIRAALACPGIELRAGVAVTALRRDAGLWQVLDAQADVMASAPVVVLASAATAAALVEPHGDPGPACETVRGQITWFDSCDALPVPLAGDGYAIDIGGRILCGAASAANDPEAGLRDADHAFNLERLRRLAGLVPAPETPLDGRVGWRERTADRLPIVGAVPVRDPAPGTRLDQVRFVPRVPGLYRLGALGGRGFTWAPLAADVLAALIDGAPVPLEADLLDAIDPARAIVRTARRQNVSV